MDLGWIEGVRRMLKGTAAPAEARLGPELMAEVCRALEEAGAEVYFTEDGTVTCLCDGVNFQMIQE